MNVTKLPVMAPRPKKSASMFKRLLWARKNLLSVWSEQEYELKFFKFKILNRQYVVCNSPETVKTVFLEEHDNYDKKSPQMRHALEPLLGDGLFVSDGALWKERRSYCAPAFNNKLMSGYFDVMVDSNNELIEEWQQKSKNGSVDVLNEMAILTGKIIGRSIFGDDTKDAEVRTIVREFSDYQKNVDQINLADSLGIPLLSFVKNPYRQFKLKSSSTRIHKVIDTIIGRHKIRENEKFNLVSMFLTGSTGELGKGHGCPLSMEAARNEAIVMFMAGHETTANTLSWTWYLLSEHPEAMKKLQQELDDVLGGRQPTLEDIDKLHYTRAVFEESMRLYPPVPLLSREAREDAVINGKKIEKGANILVVPWLLHRHKAYWDKPDEFIPERFLPDAPQPNKFVYIPFSVGYRVCLGKRFGMVEGIVCLAMLAQKFTPKLVHPEKTEIECRLTLRPKSGMPMTLNQRDGELNES